MSLSLGLGLGLTRNKGGGVLRFTGALPSQVSYSRAGAATAVTSGGVIVPFAANAPPITDVGLLLEVASTNLLLRSQEFDVTWTKTSASVTANQATAPDGTQTVDTLTASATTGMASQTVTTVGATDYHFSLFVKQKTSAQSRLLFRDVTNGVNILQATAITWSAGVPTIGGQFGTGTWDAPVAYAGGVYRLGGTAKMGTGGVSASLQVFPDNLVGSNALDVWGAQFVPGVVAGSYIPTTAAQATRGLPTCTVAIPAGRTKARVTYGRSSTVVDLTGLTPGGTLDLVTGRPWLGLGNELRSLQWMA